MVIGPDVPAEIGRLKQEPGGDLVVFGSGDLLRTLIEADLVDEYHVLIFPLALGSGKRMFPESGAPLHFHLTATAVTTTGVVINSYVTQPPGAEPPHPPAGGWGGSDE